MRVKEIYIFWNVLKIHHSLVILNRKWLICRSYFKIRIFTILIHRNLAYLKIYDLPEIKDKEKIVEELQEKLPHCAILFPYAQAEELQSKKDD